MGGVKSRLKRDLSSTSILSGKHYEWMEILLLAFFRVECQANHHHIAPDMVNLCLLYCSVGDMWDVQTSDKLIEYEHADTVISKIDQGIGRSYAFGQETCEWGQKRLWKFRVGLGGGKGLSIGVVDRKFIGNEANEFVLDSNS